MLNKQQALELEQQVLVLALNKVATDWYRNGFMHSEGPEKYFEDWIFANNIPFNKTFENKLFSLFIKFLLMRGKVCGR